jgi:DNA mismatch repair protein MutL
LSHIVQIATNYAFAFPELALQLWHNDRKLIQLDPVKHLQERVYQHFGKDFLDHLLPLEANHNDWRLHGAVSHPRFRRPSRQFQYLFVNQRLVRDKVLTHAVVEAYREFGFATGDHPAVFLFLDVPGDELDVNVHPAKTEIRFIQSGYIHDFVRDALKACLLRKPHTVASSSGSDPLRETAGNESASPSDAGDPLGSSPGGLPRFLPPSYPVRERFDPYRALVAPAASGEPSRTNPVEHWPDTAQESQVLPSMEWTQTPTCLGQFRASFLLAESQDTLLIIDQHVAHERLLYDRLRKAYEQQAVERQVFAVPIPLELTLAEAHVSQTWLPLLDAFGFELTPFDGGSFVIRSGPAFLPFSQVEASVHDLLALARGKSRETAVEAFLDHLCASRACKAAVKINMPLNLTQGQDLIDQLWRSQSPLVCPHGRPIVIELSWLELEKRFKRR